MSVKSYREVLECDELDNLDYPQGRKETIGVSHENEYKNEHVSRYNSPQKHNKPLNEELLVKELDQLAEILDGTTKKTAHTINRNSPTKWSSFDDKVNFLVHENTTLAEQVHLSNHETHKLLQTLQQTQESLDENSQKYADTKQTLKDLTKDLTDQVDQKEDLYYKLTRQQSLYDQLTLDLNKTSKERDNKQHEIRILLKQSRDTKMALQEITDKYSMHVKESECILQREDGLLKKIRGLEDKIESVRKDKEKVVNKFDKQRLELDETMKMVGGLKHRIGELEKQEFEHYKIMQDMKDQMKENDLVKDKSLTEKKHLLVENESLKLKLNTVHLKAREKVELEVNSLRTQSLQEKRKLVDEMNQMEEERVSMQGLMERAIRDKRQAETDLSRLTKSIPEESLRLNMTLEDLSTRLSHSERERNESMRKLEQLSHKLHREESRHETEKSQNNLLLDDIYKRLRRSESELEESKQDKVKVLAKKGEIERLRKVAEDEFYLVKSQYGVEKMALVEKVEVERKSVEGQLNLMSKEHEKVVRELQRAACEHRLQQEKWNEESKFTVIKYESSIQHINSQLKKQKDRQQETDQQLFTLKSERDLLIQELNSCRNDFSKMQVSVGTAEIKFEKAAQQVQNLLTKESDNAAEKQRMQTQLNRLSKDRDKFLNEKWSEYKPFRTTTALKDEVIKPEVLRRELDRVKERVSNQEDIYDAINEISLISDY